MNFAQNLSGSANFESVLTILFFDVALCKIFIGFYKKSDFFVYRVYFKQCNKYIV
jgi:hypothetical protein